MDISEPKLKILEILYKELPEELHIREVQRRTGLNYERVNKYLNDLEQLGILKSRRKGRLKLYKIDTLSPYGLQFLSIIEIKKQREFSSKNPLIWNMLSKFTNDVKKGLDGKILSIVLFGSVARGKYARDSDVDILIITPDLSIEEKTQLESIVTRISSKSSASYGFDLVPIRVTLPDLKEGFKNRDFYKDLWEDHILLYGETKFVEVICDVKE